MPKSHIYKSGLTFSQGLADNLDSIKNRVTVQNKASLIIIDGGIGEGKTTLAVQISEYLQSGPIVFKEQLAMGGQDFIKKLKICFQNRYLVIIYDEAGDFNKRGALTRFNALLNRVFETYRAFKIIVILVLPSFHVLDDSLLDKKIPRLLIHTHKRTLKYGSFRAYSLYRMYYLRNVMLKLIVKPFAYGLVDANFRGNFLDLTPARCKELDLHSTRGKFNILEMAEIKHQGLIDYEEISKRVNKSIIWCRVAINKLRIKHKKVYKRKRYYDNSVIDRLLDYIDGAGK
jgi:hypothetical protein